MSRRSVHRDVFPLLKQVEEQGGRWEVTKRSHVIVYNAAGRRVAGNGSTPSDHRSLLNFARDLRHAGFTIKRK